MKSDNNKKVFAKGLYFAKLFIIFLIGSVFGTFYEEILNFVNTHQWSSRKGLLIGPLNPIYGIPAVILILILAKNNGKRGIIKTYIYSCIISGVAEYLMSYLGEILFGVKFWDYNGYLLNINGRTTIPFMLFWGVLGLILLKVIYPFVSSKIESVSYLVAAPMYGILLAFIIFDIALTYSVFGRMHLRNLGKEPYTLIGAYYDSVFTDEYLSNEFPAMRKAK